MSTTIPATRYFFSTAEALAEGPPGKLFLLYRIVPVREFYVPGNDDAEIRNITTDEDMDEDNELAVGDPFFQIEGCTAEGWDKAEVVVTCEVTEENAVNVLKKMGAVECNAKGFDSDAARFAQLIGSAERMGGFAQGSGLATDVMTDLGWSHAKLEEVLVRARAAEERGKAAIELLYADGQHDV